MSRGLIVAALVACADSHVPSTSLAGSAACEDMSCGSGTICVIQYAGVDAGANGVSCVTPPAGCAFVDCHGTACPPCLASLCALDAELVPLVSFEGRTLSCPGQ